MKYIDIREASLRWGISDRRIRLLCSEGRIDGAIKLGWSWIIPDETPKPRDGRVLRRYKALDIRPGSVDVDALQRNMERTPVTIELLGTSAFRGIFRESIVSVDYAQNLVVIKTMPGLANAAACGVDVAVDVADVFAAGYAPGAFDLVTCNPPYVLPSERAGMDDTVLSHEPVTALFVPEDEPLLYYRAVGEGARRWLRGGGVLLFEINRAFADETCALLRSLGYVGVEAARDYVSNWRFVKAVKE